MPDELEDTLNEIENAPDVEPAKPEPEAKPEPKTPTDEEILAGIFTKRPDLYERLVESAKPAAEPKAEEEEDDYAKGVVSKAVRTVQERHTLERGIMRQVREAMASEDVDIPEAWFSQLEEVIASPDYDVPSLRKALQSRVFVTNAKGVLHDAIKNGSVKVRETPKAKVEEITPTVNKTRTNNRTKDEDAGVRRFAAALGLSADDFDGVSK